MEPPPRTCIGKIVEVPDAPYGSVSALFVIVTSHFVDIDMNDWSNDGRKSNLCHTAGLQMVD